MPGSSHGYRRHIPTSHQAWASGKVGSKSIPGNHCYLEMTSNNLTTNRSGCKSPNPTVFLTHFPLLRSQKVTPTQEEAKVWIFSFKVCPSAPPRALQGVCTQEGPWRCSTAGFQVNTRMAGSHDNESVGGSGGEGATPGLEWETGACFTFHNALSIPLYTQRFHRRNNRQVLFVCLFYQARFHQRLS